MTKVATLIVISLVTIIMLIKNLNNWSRGFREYMMRQSHKVFGNRSGWERPWAIVLSKAMILFFGLMLLILVYALLFS